MTRQEAIQEEIARYVAACNQRNTKRAHTHLIVIERLRGGIEHHNVTLLRGHAT